MMIVVDMLFCCEFNEIVATTKQRPKETKRNKEPKKAIRREKCIILKLFPFQSAFFKVIFCILDIRLAACISPRSLAGIRNALEK